MFTRTAIALLLLNAGSFSSAAPIEQHYRRAVTSLNAEATAESHVRDVTATRAFSAVPIKTSDGNCLFVDELSGDFRANLTPIQTVACDGSVGQQWDIITAGKHNNVAGQALIVNVKTQACLNFDPRRAAGNQVLLFSCGGRADGSGEITNSQQYAFKAGVVAGPITLKPLSSPTTCLTVTAGKLDQTSCSTSAQQLFTIGGAASAPASPAPAVTVSSSVAQVPATTSIVAATSTIVASPATATGTTVLNVALVAEAHPRDATATRALSGVPVKTANGQCLSVDAQSGDFRANLIPVTVRACDGSAGQSFDVITKGKHNNQDGRALIVSTLTQGCMMFDSRRDSVILFSCGGRADGSGDISDSQLFAFTGTAGPIALLPKNSATTCLTVNGASVVSSTCVPAQASGQQLFTFGAAGAAPAAPAPVALSTSAIIAPPSSTVVAAPATLTTPSTPVATAPIATGTAVLNAEAVAEAHVRDATATRAKSGVTVKTSTGQCLSVDARSGDFRSNLLPITVQDCNGSDGQKFDVITKGKHNDQAGQALIVSALTQGCLNFDPRRAAGNQVNLFSCGGRAAGEGIVTDSQLFAFDGTSNTIPLTPANSRKASCLVPKGGKIDVEACNAASPSATELFTLG